MRLLEQLPASSKNGVVWKYLGQNGKGATQHLQSSSRGSPRQGLANQVAGALNGETF
jgi:hypothetical protein